MHRVSALAAITSRRGKAPRLLAPTHSYELRACLDCCSGLCDAALGLGVRDVDQNATRNIGAGHFADLLAVVEEGLIGDGAVQLGCVGLVRLQPKSTVALVAGDEFGFREAQHDIFKMNSSMWFRNMGPDGKDPSPAKNSTATHLFRIGPDSRGYRRNAREPLTSGRNTDRSTASCSATRTGHQKCATRRPASARYARPRRRIRRTAGPAVGGTSPAGGFPSSCDYRQAMLQQLAQLRTTRRPIAGGS
jgi:hypothetical protein